MKRTALAGSFFLLTGLVSLILLASIVYSCRQGGRPHEMGTEASGSSHSTITVPASPSVVEQSEPVEQGVSPALHALGSTQRG